MPVDPRLLAVVAEAFERSRALNAQARQAAPPVTPEEEEDQGFFKDYVQDPFRIALEAPRAGLGYWAGRLAPEAYNRAFAENVQNVGPEDEDLAGTLTHAPSAGQVALESLFPGEPETGIGKGAKQAGIFASEVLTDPYTLVPGATLGRAGKAARLATKAVSGGNVARAAKLGGKALTLGAASAAPAAVAYGKDLYEGTVGAGSQALESYRRGDMEGAKAGAVQAALTGGLALGLGAGIAHDVKSIRKARQVAARATDPPVGKSQVVAEIEAKEAQEVAQDIPQEPEILEDIPPDAQDAVNIEGLADEVAAPPPDAIPALDPSVIVSPEDVTRGVGEVVPEQAVEAPQTQQIVDEIAPETPVETQPSPKVTPEQETALNARQQQHFDELAYIERQVNRGVWDKEQGDKKRKAAGMRYAADKRQITGQLTAKEKAAADKDAKKVRVGRTVRLADGTEGVVVGQGKNKSQPVSFGKVKVQVGDEVKTVSRGDLKVKSGDAFFQLEDPLPEGFQVVNRNGVYGVVDPQGKPVTGAISDVSPEDAISKYQAKTTPAKKPIEEALLDAYKADLPAQRGLSSVPIAATQKRLLEQGYSREEVRDVLASMHKESRVALLREDVPANVPKEDRPFLPGADPKGDIGRAHPYSKWKPVEGKFQPETAAKDTPQPLSPQDIQRAFDKELPGTKVEERDNLYYADFADGQSLVVDPTVGVIRVLDHTNPEAFKAVYGKNPPKDLLAHGVTIPRGNEVWVKLARTATLETFIHEVKAHAALALGVMKREEAKDILEFYGKGLDKTDSNWLKQAEEKFADALGKGQVPKVARGPLQRAWQFIKKLVKGLNLEERTARAIEAIPQRFREAQAGATTRGRVPSGTAKPIPPGAVSERVLKTEEYAKETPKQTVTGPLEEGAKPGGKPDVTINIDRLKEVQADNPDLSDEAIQRFVDMAKDLQPDLSRAETVKMSGGALQELAESAFRGKTLTEIEKIFKSKGWGPEEVGYFSNLHNKMALDEAAAYKNLQIAPTVANEVAYMQARAAYKAMTAFIGDRKTEAGRLLKAWHYASGTAKDVPEQVAGWQVTTGNPQIDRLLKRDVNDQRFTQGEAEDLAKVYRDKGVEEFMNAYEDSFNPSTFDKVLELRTKGLLSGPSTQIVNITSNAFLAGVRLLERSTLEPLISKVIPSNTSKRYGREGVARVQGFRNALMGPDGAVKQLFKDLRHIGTLKRLEAKTPTLDPTRGKALGKAEVNVWRPQAVTGKGPVGKAAAETLSWGVKSLEAFDSFFKSLAAGQELSGQAYIKLRKEGLSHADAMKELPKRVAGLTNYANNPPKMPDNLTPDERKAWLADTRNTWEARTLRKVEEVALEDTLQAKLGKGGRAMEQTIKHNPFLKFIIPFFRTPINIFKESGKRTPGISQILALNELMAARRNPEHYPKAVENIAKSFSGALIAGSALYMASELSDPEGHVEIVGAGPPDPRLHKTWRDLGYIPYSIRVGDNFYEYGRIEPFASTIGVVADYVDAQKRGDTKTASDKAVTIMNTARENFLNKTFMQGLEGMFTVIHEPERNLDYYVRNMLTSFIPSGIRAAARATDPVIRQKDKVLGEGPLDWFKGAVPGLSTTLEAKKDLTGEEVTRQNPYSPFQISKRKTGKKADFQRELLNVGYNPSVRRTIVDRKTGETIRLTKQEQDRLWEIRKATMDDLANRMLSDPTYKRLPTPYAKKQYISRLISRRERKFKEQIYNRARQRARAS